MPGFEPDASLSQSGSWRLRRSAEETSKRIVAEAEREADTLRKSALLSGREELMKLREAWETEVRDRRTEVEREEKRVKERESVLDRKFEVLDQREKEINGRASDVELKRKRQAERDQELDRLTTEAQRRIEQLAGMSAEDAKLELMHRMEEEAQADAANRVREIREARAVPPNARPRRSSRSPFNASRRSTLPSRPRPPSRCPNDEMKGRIIGREGRNIRAFELATGVDVIIDDTPDTVVVSCFEPVRREVARLALEKLVADGRIHPGRIEEVVNKARHEVDAAIVETGEEAAYETGVHGLHPELDEADRPDALADQLWPEHPRALQGSRVAGGHHGRRAWIGRWPGQARCACCMTSARC